MERRPSAWWGHLSERRALRSLLYTIMGVSGALIVTRYVVWLPGYINPRTSDVDRLVTLIRTRMDLSMLIVVFVLCVVGLAASTKPDPPS